VFEPRLINNPSVFRGYNSKTAQTFAEVINHDLQNEFKKILCFYKCIRKPQKPQKIMAK